MIINKIVEYFEKKIFPMDCGEAKTCFHVLFLYSICTIMLQTIITHSGNKKIKNDCHAIPKRACHGFEAKSGSLRNSFGFRIITNVKMAGINPAPRMHIHKAALRFAFIISVLNDIA
jgi:hypothetical protein